MHVSFKVESGGKPLSVRARQVCASFDVPPEEKQALRWDFAFPYEDEPWSVGLVVGPSGSGKSSVLNHVWGHPKPHVWTDRPVIDDFAKRISVEQITNACSSVGFNTIPAWLRPHAVLSNGEKFRVELARSIAEAEGDAPIVVDEFTSVVDRQVAQVGSHAVQKFVRKAGKKFVAVTCHYDVIDWLQPDWVLDMATRSFTRRRLQRRPAIDICIGRVPYAAWNLFKPFHYMSAEMHRACRCFGLWANGQLVAFAGIMHFMHATVHDIRRVSRVVTLPDWQGLGLAMVLLEKLGEAFTAVGERLRMYPAHPSLIRTFERSPQWHQCVEAGMKSTSSKKGWGARPCAVFEFCGKAGDPRESQRLLAL